MQRSSLYKTGAGYSLILLFASFLFMQCTVSTTAFAGSRTDMFEKVYDFSHFAHIHKLVKLKPAIPLNKTISMLRARISSEISGFSPVDKDFTFRPFTSHNRIKLLFSGVLRL